MTAPTASTATTASAAASAAASLPDILCHLNGETLPLREAKISVMDRGFIFGDGIYEVIPVYGRRLFRFDEHMARLDRSLAKLRIANPHPKDGWLALARQLVAAQAADDQLVYLQVTRGVAPRDHVMPAGITPTVFAMSNPMKPPSAEHAAPWCGLHHSARLPLGAGRHQEHLSAGQCAGPADVGRPWGGGDHHVPRRLVDRGLGLQRLGRARGRAARPAQERAMCSRASAYNLMAELCEEVGHRPQPAPDQRGRCAGR